MSEIVYVVPVNDVLQPLKYAAQSIEETRVMLTQIEYKMNSVSTEVSLLSGEYDVQFDTIKDGLASVSWKLDDIVLGLWGTNLQLESISGNGENINERLDTVIEVCNTQLGEIIYSLDLMLEGYSIGHDIIIENIEAINTNLGAVNESLGLIANEYGEYLKTITASIDTVNSNMELTNSNISAVGIQLNFLIVLLSVIIVYGVGKFLWRILYGWFFA